MQSAVAVAQHHNAASSIWAQSLDLDAEAIMADSFAVRTFGLHFDCSDMTDQILASFENDNCERNFENF